MIVYKTIEEIFMPNALAGARTGELGKDLGILLSDLVTSFDRTSESLRIKGDGKAGFRVYSALPKPAECFRFMFSIT